VIITLADFDPAIIEEYHIPKPEKVALAVQLLEKLRIRGKEM